MPTTFESYDASQAQLYNETRSSFPREVIDEILDFHKMTGGERDVLVDVGCGPGNSTRVFASHFGTAYGVDRGEAMIEAARTASDGTMHFSIGSAETFSQDLNLEPGSVDLITAVTAAHWFDMPRFWQAAKGVMKRGGTVALCGGSWVYCHPNTPGASAIQASLVRLREVDLKDSLEPGSLVAQSLYRDLLLPWTSDPPVDGFDQSSFVRKEWNKDGTLEEGADDFRFGSHLWSLSDLERRLNTSSAVTRWRQARGKTAGGEDDCVKRTLDEVRDALRSAGVNDADFKIRIGHALVMMLIKRL